MIVRECWRSSRGAASAAGSSCGCTHAAEERSRARITACAQASNNRLEIAYFLPVATRERPASEGGARENPSLSPQPCSNGTLPSPRYPTEPTHRRAHVHAPIQHGHKNALAVKQAAYLGRTKSTKETQASPGSALQHTSEHKTLTRTAASTPSLHLLD